MRLLLGIFIAALLIGWLIWPYYREERASAEKLLEASRQPTTQAPSNSSSAKAGPANSQDEIPPFPLNAAGHDIRTDLRLMSEMIDTFRTNFPKDGNPTGSNAEITAALTGKNKVRFAFIAPNHPAINRAGELCDRWGTPFFFHAESATRMEIRSAGPDRKLWTDDDVAYTP